MESGRPGGWCVGQRGQCTPTQGRIGLRGRGAGPGARRRGRWPSVWGWPAPPSFWRVLVWSLGAPFRAGGPGLSLAWATAEPWATEGGPTLVELRLVVDNDGRQRTQSTSILWEPAFASRFTLISSDPPAWRVRIDERGWGVLDTAGLLPSRSGTFRLWFDGPPTGGRRQPRGGRLRWGGRSRRG